MSRIAYGFLSMIIIIFVFSVAYLMITPAFDTWVEISSQLSPEIEDTIGFINIAWDLLPLAMIISLIIWGVLAGMGAASNPGRVAFGWLVLVAALNGMMLGYVTVDPVIQSLSSVGLQAGGMFSPVVSFLQMMWQAYPIPAFFALLIWTFAQSLATEPNTEYLS